MKYTLLSCVAALALLPCEAVQTAENYEAAKELVQDDGYLLFAYAEDWDTYSKRVCDRLMAAEAVKLAAGQAVFMRVPIPNVLTDERKAANKERFGPLQVADAPDYPADPADRIREEPDYAAHAAEHAGPESIQEEKNPADVRSERLSGGSDLALPGGCLRQTGRPLY